MKPVHYFTNNALAANNSFYATCHQVGYQFHARVGLDRESLHHVFETGSRTFLVDSRLNGVSKGSLNAGYQD